MKNIPIEEMDMRRLRVELSSAWTANQLLLVMTQEHKTCGKDQIFHYCTKGIAPYPRVLCSVCPNIAPDDAFEFNAYERLKELEDVNKKLDALEAAGVDNWDGYDYAMELMEEDV